MIIPRRLLTDEGKLPSEYGFCDVSMKYSRPIYFSVNDTGQSMKSESMKAKNQMTLQTFRKSHFLGLIHFICHSQIKNIKYINAEHVQDVNQK